MLENSRMTVLYYYKIVVTLKLQNMHLNHAKANEILSKIAKKYLFVVLI
jgi:hypothetical protein